MEVITFPQSLNNEPILSSSHSLHFSAYGTAKGNVALVVSLSPSHISPRRPLTTKFEGHKELDSEHTSFEFCDR